MSFFLGEINFLRKENIVSLGKGLYTRGHHDALIWLVSERGYIVRIVRRRVKERLYAMTDGLFQSEGI